AEAHRATHPAPSRLRGGCVVEVPVESSRCGCLLAGTHFQDNDARHGSACSSEARHGVECGRTESGLVPDSAQADKPVLSLSKGRGCTCSDGMGASAYHLIVVFRPGELDPPVTASMCQGGSANHHLSRRIRHASY